MQNVSISVKAVEQLSINDPVLAALLRMAPSLGVGIGIVYSHLESNEQRRALLGLAVNQNGFKVAGDEIVSVEARPPFHVQFDNLLVEMAGVEPASKEAGCKRLRV